MQLYERAVSHARMQVGIAEIDITPPVGIYNRCWGAATHETAAGIHRPLIANMWLCKNADETVIIVGIDASWWQSKALERKSRHAIAVAAGVRDDQVLICLSHSHAAVPLTDEESDVPGGDILQAYAVALPERLAELTRAALNNLESSTLQCGYGVCDLASQRDECRDGQWVVGSDPASAVDHTLTVGRLCDANGELRSLLVNYACHPTTLAWENTLISPDFIGAMRAQLEQVYGVPVLFILGACGDLAPRRQYTGDVTLADSNGRQLACAVQAALEALPEIGSVLVPTKVVQSGADLGCWENVPDDSTTQDALSVKQTDVRIPWREDFPSIESLERDLSQADGAIAERLRRRLRLRRSLDKDGAIDFSIMSACFGDILFLGTPAEPFSALQIEARQRHPQQVVIVANHCNGGSGYLMPESCYERTEFYAATQTPFAKGSFEQVCSLSYQCLEDLAVKENTCQQP